MIENKSVYSVTFEIEQPNLLALEVCFYLGVREQISNQALGDVLTLSLLSELLNVTVCTCGAHLSLYVAVTWGAGLPPGAMPHPHAALLVTGPRCDSLEASV